jgi:hypothetical protein
MNIPDQPIAIYHQTHNYTELRQQIHDDLRIQRVYRSSSSRTRTGSNWKVKTYGRCFKAS